MEHRSLLLAAGLILALSRAPLGLAADDPTPAGEPSAAQKAAWEERLREAKSLQRDAKAKKDESERRYEAEQKACFSRFRVYDCQDAARQRHLAVAAEARKIENYGLALERQVKKEQLADKDARRAAEAPQREADLRERETEVAADRAETAAIQEKKMADKAVKAEEGARRRADDEARRQKKQERHEREMAEKMEKAKRPEAEAAR